MISDEPLAPQRRNEFTSNAWDKNEGTTKAKSPTILKDHYDNLCELHSALGSLYLRLNDKCIEIFGHEPEEINQTKNPEEHAESTISKISLMMFKIENVVRNIHFKIDKLETL